MNEFGDEPRPDPTTSVFVEGGTGYAAHVPAGHTFVMSLPNGPQVVDLDVFDAHNPNESFGQSITRIAYGAHLDVGDQLLSRAPHGEPLMRIVRNTVVDHDELEATGARAWTHDLIFGRCSRTQRRRRYNSDTPGCQEFITEAIEPFGLTQYDVHDPLNVFMTTGLDPDGNLFHVPSRARAGDEFGLRALKDCIVALSACPGSSSGKTPNGVQVSIYPH